MLSQVVVPIPAVRHVGILRVVYALVSDDNVVILQQRANVPDELRTSLLGLDIIALSMPEAEEVFESHRDGRFACRKVRTGQQNHESQSPHQHRAPQSAG